MRYLIGIDEAGYGPNLGPLVQAAIAIAVPADVRNLWSALRRKVRRADDDEDGRMLIDDSKLVYIGPDGFKRLERTVVGVLPRMGPVGQVLGDVACDPSCDDLANEAWYQADEPLPVAHTDDELGSQRGFAEILQAIDGGFGAVRAVVTPAPRFNALLEEWDSKGAVLAHGLIKLLGEIDRALPAGAALDFVIDKHGGRNFYAPIIHTAFPDGWVVPLVESADESSYRIDGLGRPVTLRFTPRADGNSLPVALASMHAKYLREVFMRQFNRFWRTHVPDIEPTAGYPTDSGRFYALIQRAMRQLGIQERQVWRQR
jgi:hypothetical protein